MAEDNVRARLARHLQDGGWHCGEALARGLGISREAVGKQIDVLRAYGLAIRSVPGAGYRLAQPLELLDVAEIRHYLDRAGARVCVELFPELESTNTCLMSRSPGVGIHACLAEYQSGGRGRRGRRWAAPFGAGICVSIGWRFARIPPDLAALPLAVGIVCADFLRGFGAEGVSVKWPNDLVVAGRKLGGILVEHRGEAGGAGRVVIGIGLNVSMNGAQGEAVDQPWVSLDQVLSSQVTRPPSRNRVAAGLISAVAAVRDAFREEGFAPFRDRWPEFDAARDRAVRVQAPGGAFEGTARGVDEDGALLVETDNGRYRVVSGEVSLRFAHATTGR